MNSYECDCHRSRMLYTLLAVITIAMGLVSRSSLISLPAFLSSYAGDTLWALMVFWMFCVLLNRQATWKIALYAITFSFSIEFSQFYHEPWIDEIRHTKLGGLALGYAFKLSDLTCYFAGVCMGIFIDYFVISRSSKHNRLRR